MAADIPRCICGRGAESFIDPECLDGGDFIYRSDLPPERPARCPFQPSLVQLQGWGPHREGRPVPGPHRPSEKNFFLTSNLSFLLFEFKAVPSCSVVFSQGGKSTYFSISSLSTLKDQSEISLSLLQAEQAQLPHPFVIGQQNLVLTPGSVISAYCTPIV